ncbi:MAG: dihydroxy-acid dehydratase, partial [Pirellulales bacterium]
CRACASPGGGCQFLGTAATAQVVAEAIGLTVPHAALAPSGQSVWRDVAVRSARTLVGLGRQGLTTRDIVTAASLRNAMVVHAAFGGSTNLLLHIPAIAHAAGLTCPTIDDWIHVNRQTPRLVSVLPNGPIHHPTVRVFLAGGVPEVMIHLEELGLLDTSVTTVLGVTLAEQLDVWRTSHRRQQFRKILWARDSVDAEEVIMTPEQAKKRGMCGTTAFLRGTLAPEGAVVKAAAISTDRIDAHGIYEHTGPARVFTSEASAMQCIKAGGIHQGDVVVLAGIGPMGTGMEETYQVTGALKQLDFRSHVALITDARFSGVSTGACIGHVGPEALAGGPLGKVIDGDVIRIVIDTQHSHGSVDLVGHLSKVFAPEEAADVLANRKMRSDLAPDSRLPEDTRLWSILQQASGGTWAGCVYDAARISQCLNATYEEGECDANGESNE